MFPTDLVDLPNPDPRAPTNSPVTPLAGGIANLNAVVEALQAKVGVNGSTVPASIDKRLADVESESAASAADIGAHQISPIAHVLGPYDTSAELQTAYPAASHAGARAMVNGQIYSSNGETWARETTEHVQQGVIVSNFISNVSTTTRQITLNSSQPRMVLTYVNNGGDAGILKVVLDGLGTADVAAKMARPDGHIRLNPGESRSLSFNPLTSPSSLYVQSTSALTTGSNEFQYTETGNLTLPALAAEKSPKLKFWFDCAQASPDTTLKDSSAGAHHITFEAGLSAAVAWAVPGWLSLPAVASGPKTYPTIPQATWDDAFALANGDSFLVFLRVDITPPASGNTSVCSSGYSNTGGNTGFKLRISNLGQVVGVIFGASSTVTSVNPVADISVGEHSVALFYNGQDQTVSIYVDGAADSLGNSASAAGDFTSTRGLLLGGEYLSSGTLHRGEPAVYRDIQIYCWAASAPAADAVAQIVARLHAISGPLLVSELP